MKGLCYVVVLCSVLVVTLAQTQCEQHREREQKSDAKIKLVPECDENGDYAAKQCFHGSSFCMCWRPDGSHITAPFKSLKTCACHVHKDRELAKTEKGMVGNFIPSCEEEGTYSRKQCHGSTGFCWCADETGKRVSEQVRGELNC